MALFHNRAQRHMIKCFTYFEIKYFLNIFESRISFNCNNFEDLPTPRPKFTFRNLKKKGPEIPLHRKFVLAPADRAANNVVVL